MNYLCVRATPVRRPTRLQYSHLTWLLRQQARSGDSSDDRAIADSLSLRQATSSSTWRKTLTLFLPSTKEAALCNSVQQ